MSKTVANSYFFLNINKKACHVVSLLKLKYGEEVILLHNDDNKPFGDNAKELPAHTFIETCLYIFCLFPDFVVQYILIIQDTCISVNHLLKGSHIGLLYKLCCVTNSENSSQRKAL